MLRGEVRRHLERASTYLPGEGVIDLDAVDWRELALRLREHRGEI